MAVQNKEMEIQDSQGARINPIIPNLMCPNTCIRDLTLVDRHGKRTPKIISLMKACDGYTQGIFLISRPGYPYFKQKNESKTT